MEEIKRILHEGNYSCVIKNAYGIHTYTQRGVADLYDLYTQKPEYLKDASIADKVIGKGAAALMVLGGITNVYADVISTPARRLLEDAGAKVTCGEEVPFIINRAKNGRCPLETACGDLTSAQEMLPVIIKFVTEMKKKG